MKKILISIILIVSLLCVSACDARGSFADLDNMAKQNYSVVERTVKTTSNGETLTSHFTVRSGDVVEIDYSVEQLNKIDINDMPDDFKSVKTGSVKLNGENVVEQTGDEVDVNFVAIAKVNLNFSQDYFTQVKWKSGKMTAAVSDAQGFLGSNVNYILMAVEVEYSNMLNKVTVEYITANDVTVQLTYEFTA